MGLSEPSSVHEAASEDPENEDENPHDRSTLDKDPTNEVVDALDVLAEVKLAATIRTYFCKVWILNS